MCRRRQPLALLTIAGLWCFIAAQAEQDLYLHKVQVKISDYAQGGEEKNLPAAGTGSIPIQAESKWVQGNNGKTAIIRITGSLSYTIPAKAQTGRLPFTIRAQAGFHNENLNFRQRATIWAGRGSENTDTKVIGNEDWTSKQVTYGGKFYASDNLERGSAVATLEVSSGKLRRSYTVTAYYGSRPAADTAKADTRPVTEPPASTVATSDAAPPARQPLSKLKWNSSGSKVKGQVKVVYDAATPQSDPLASGDTIEGGDTVITGPKSQATLFFDRTGSLTINQSSSIKFDAIRRSAHGTQLRITPGNGSFSGSFGGGKGPVSPMGPPNPKGPLPTKDAGGGSSGVTGPGSISTSGGRGGDIEIYTRFGVIWFISADFTVAVVDAPKAQIAVTVLTGSVTVPGTPAGVGPVTVGPGQRAVISIEGVFMTQAGPDKDWANGPKGIDGPPKEWITAPKPANGP